MGAVMETIFAGGIVFQRKIYKRAKRAGETKSEKKKPTVSAVVAHNRHQSERTLQIKIHHNFQPGDYHLVLTYGGEAPSKEDAKSRIRSFKAALGAKCKKQGHNLKWLEVTEYENHRIHHHLIVNAVVDPLVIRDLWEERSGDVHIRRLHKDRDWRRLVVYFLKETRKTYDKPDAFSKLRYTCSRNLTMPEVFYEDISAADVIADPEPLKGYCIDQSSVYFGHNPITGRPYMDYVMLPINPYKTRKRFNHKNKKKYRDESRSQWLKRNMPLQYEMELD